MIEINLMPPEMLEDAARKAKNAKLRAWRKANPEKAKATRDAWRRKHADKIRAQKKALRDADPEKYRDMHSRWLAKNPEWSANRYRADPRRYLDTQRRLKYGVTREQFDAMLEQQGYVCPISGTPIDVSAHIDHCHATGKVRAVLCKNCNQGLGQFRDDTERLRRAVSYLEAHK